MTKNSILLSAVGPNGSFFGYRAGSGQVLNKIQVAGGYLIYFRVLLGVLGISGYLGCAGYFGDFDFDDFQN